MGFVLVAESVESKVFECGFVCVCANGLMFGEAFHGQDWSVMLVEMSLCDGEE